MFHLILRAAVCSGFFLAVAETFAANRYWINSGGGSFTSPVNWSATAGGASVPLTGDIANFTLPDPNDYIVTFGSDRINDGLNVQGGTVDLQSASTTTRTYTLGGFAPLVTVQNGTLNIGGAVTDRPLVVAGAVQLTVGTSGGDAKVEVSGPNSRLDVPGILTHSIGGAGFDGTLTYRNDARGTISGTLTLGATSSTSSEGYLKVLSGAVLNVGHLRVGALGGYGDVFVDSVGSALIQTGAATLSVGNLDRIDVNDGGLFSTGTGDITLETGSDIHVFHASTFNANGNMAVTGGTISVDSGASFNLAAGKSLTASNGALIDFSNVPMRIEENSIWNIQSATEMTVAELHLADAGGPNNFGTFNIDGEDTVVTASDNGSLTVGHASDGVATINITNGGELYAYGDLSIKKTGAINVTGSSGLHLGGETALDGGTINASDGHFVSAIEHPFTASNDAQIDVDDLNIYYNWTIQSGADLRSISGITIAFSGTATLLVDGAGSTVTAGGPSRLGNFGATGQMIARNGALIDVDRLELAGIPDSGGIVRIESGAQMLVGRLQVAVFGGSDNTGTITVTGAGSTLVQKGANPVTLGYISEGSATINILDGGTFSMSTGTLFLNPTGAINLDGGTFIVNGTVAHNGGAFNFIAGEINFPADFAPQHGGLLGGNVTLNNQQALNVAGTTTINAFRGITLDGGSFSTGDLLVDGTLVFRRGTLAIAGLGGLAIGPAGPLGSTVTVGGGQTVNVSHTAIVQAGASLLLQTGGTFNAATLVNNGHVVLDGVNSTLAGGAMTNAGVLRGNGQITAAVANGAFGEIRAESGKTLLFTAPPGSNHGLVNLQGGTLHFAGQLTNAAGGRIAGRGALITGGAGLTNDGDIALSSGITDVFGDVDNAAGGRITVSGNADATFWDDVTSGGALFKVSAGSSATFFGTLAGAGISGPGDVYAEADVTPGFSPGVASFGGDLTLAETANLLIELAGVTPGEQHDQLAVAGELSLAGDLTVQTISGFMPSLSNEFVIATYASHTGQFDALAVPPLPAGLNWSLEYGAHELILTTTSTMLPGDIDLDGDVDRTDAALFTPHLGAATASVWITGDFDGDGMTTLHDLALQQANFGATLPSPAAANAIPEPSSIISCWSD
jgi:T5SS/PEP-CTERM-associated repeat protein